MQGTVRACKALLGFLILFHTSHTVLQRTLVTAGSPSAGCRKPCNGYESLIGQPQCYGRQHGTGSVCHVCKIQHKSAHPPAKASPHPKGLTSAASMGRPCIERTQVLPYALLLLHLN